MAFKCDVYCDLSLSEVLELLNNDDVDNLTTKIVEAVGGQVYVRKKKPGTNCSINVLL